MKLTVDKRYLVLPVSAHAQIKKLCFRNEEGKLVYDLDAKLDPLGAQFSYYADMGRFMGQTLELACSPEIGFEPVQTDCVPPAGGERFRPAAHFSAERGWINDPNGLILYEGQYHLFFQHNPAGPDWGNMHWGHAVSSDLVHWDQKEIVLFPDEMGTMFSGSAIADEKNVSGLGRDGRAPILLFYTAAGGTSELSKEVPFTQCLAYSADGGETFEKYAGNPVVKHIEGGNRDPKVIFCEELDAYVMALYLDGRRFVLLTSANLLEWNELQQIEIPGDDECPDFYPLMLDGEKYWVLSGAHDCYFVGKIENGRFVPVQQAARLGSADHKAYAAQTFSGLADMRRVRISWNTFRLPGMPFNGSMGTPVDMYLTRIGGEIRLACRPVPEIKALHGKHVAGCGRVQLPGAANDVLVRIPTDAGKLAISMMGCKIEVDTASGEVKLAGLTMHALPQEGVISLRVIQDVHAIELFPVVGAGYLCAGHLADCSLNYADAPQCVSVEAVELKNYRA